jgi:hypothetical protein
VSDRAQLDEDLKRIATDTPARSLSLEAGVDLAGAHSFEAWSELGVRASEHVALSARATLDDSGALSTGVRLTVNW